MILRRKTLFRIVYNCFQFLKQGLPSVKLLTKAFFETFVMTTDFPTNKKALDSLSSASLFGDDRVRTDDPHNAIVVLFQLSYVP